MHPISLSLSLSLSLSHTHTHTHTQAPTYTSIPTIQNLIYKQLKTAKKQTWGRERQQHGMENSRSIILEKETSWGLIWRSPREGFCVRGRGKLSHGVSLSGNLTGNFQKESKQQPALPCLKGTQARKCHSPHRLETKCMQTFCDGISRKLSCCFSRTLVY